MATSGDGNNFWPDSVWLVGDTYNKQRTTSNEDGAIEYVRGDAYHQLLEWCRVMIIEGEACPCTLPDLIEQEEVTEQTP